MFRVQTASFVRPENLDISTIDQGWGTPHKDESVAGKPLTVDGKVYSHGLGTHAVSTFIINLKGDATEFTAQAGLDDEATVQGSVDFQVWVDGREIAHSPVMKKGDAPYNFTVSLVGAKKLALIVGDGGDGINYDHADWLSPKIFVNEGDEAMIQAYVPPPEPMPVLANNFRPAAELHNALTYGCSANKPFMYLIPCSGDRPIQYSAVGLPHGLHLNRKTGMIIGTVHHKKIYHVMLTAKNAHGISHREFTIKSLGLLALTPPMGWNSWNVWAGSVNAAKIRAAADEMTKDGLSEFGYQYVNIDDTWEAGRSPSGEIMPNKKFVNMKKLAEYVHSLGLKIGLYSSPGPTTCAGYTASYKHEQQDANTYAKWGFDYLKYDWCSYGQIAPHPDLAGYQKPYRLMASCLAKSGRDIVFSLCQYGMGDVWNWGRSVGGNLWRTTGDINDSWASMSANGFGGSKWAKGAGPGGWNDPDMLVVGKLGWSGNPRPTKLTPNEQVTHISLWSMLAAPLIMGCDLTQIDPFTLRLLTNPEVIDVDQDPLGKPGTRLLTVGQTEVWTRPLYDGHYAVALFNRGEFSSKITIPFRDLGLKGAHLVRDLWTRKTLGKYSGSFHAVVPRHGCVLVKIF